MVKYIYVIYHQLESVNKYKLHSSGLYTSNLEISANATSPLDILQWIKSNILAFGSILISKGLVAIILLVLIFFIFNMNGSTAR